MVQALCRVIIGFPWLYSPAAVSMTVSRKSFTLLRIAQNYAQVMKLMSSNEPDESLFLSMILDLDVVLFGPYRPWRRPKTGH